MPPFGEVDVVVEEHVPRLHRLDREVADHRVHQRGVRPPGQLAQQAVVDPGAEVVRVTDHRRPRGAADGGLDLLLDRGQRSRDDLDEDRVGLDLGATSPILVASGGAKIPILVAHRAVPFVSSRLP
jgi:hypothetical protein